MINGTLIVHDWDKWQSYRSDRGTPPWIKVHRNIMTSAKWAYLSDAEKGQLVSIWIIAADRDGTIPSCPKMLRKMCQLDDDPNINKFIELGFVETVDGQADVNVTPDRRHGDAPETETETETEYLSQAELLVATCLLRKPNKKLNGRHRNDWASCIEKMVRLDGRSVDEIERSLLWYHSHWNDNQYIPVIESGKALREKYDKLLNAMQRSKDSAGGDDGWK